MRIPTGFVSAPVIGVVALRRDQGERDAHARRVLHVHQALAVVAQVRRLDVEVFVVVFVRH